MSTLKQLVDETTNIKNELKICHTDLKDNLIEKGINALSSDKLAILVEKVKELPYIEGYNELPVWYKTLFKFKNYWFSCKNISIARVGMGACTVNNKIYCIGGDSSSVNECYDPSENTWATLKNMSVARGYFKPAVVNNKIYCVSGSTGGSNSTANECYNPNTNTWTTLKAFPSNGFLPCTEAVGDKIYCIGQGGYNNIYCYNPSTNTWTSLGVTPSYWHGMVTFVINGKIHCMSNRNNHNYYNPTSKSWTTLNDTPTVTNSAGVVGNNVYCISSGGSPHYRYTPSADEWAVMDNSMPSNKMSWATSVAYDRIHYIGGSSTTHECYIPQGGNYEL